MFKSTKQGAQTTIHLAVSEDVKGVSGTYVANKPYGYIYILYYLLNNLLVCFMQGGGYSRVFGLINYTMKVKAIVCL